MTDPSSIGARLREERLRLGRNQGDFAAIANTTKRSQYEYEKDGAPPAPSTLPPSLRKALMSNTSSQGFDRPVR